ncbi:MAG: hypothetical protein A2Y10_09820 [Planctomycetes bacterium GWF2_41_51]|nr:MAG: hypothetical protein A2Y10_09820 [Planctomycetes bacterium GWF2_41_51]
MKAKISLTAFYLLTIILGGCVPSLHPLFTENELVFDSNLVGKWSEPNSSDIWEFKTADNKRYEFVLTQDKGKGVFTGMLGKIGNEFYLDIFPEDMNIPGNDFYKGHLIGAHSFMKIDVTKDSLKIGIMSPESVKKILEAEPNAIKHEKVDDRIILTASTKALKDFILKYAADEKAELFGKDEDNKPLRRVSVQEANEPENTEPNQPR